MNDLINDPRAKRWGNVAKVGVLGTGCVFVAADRWRETVLTC